MLGVVFVHYLLELCFVSLCQSQDYTLVKSHKNLAAHQKHPSGCSPSDVSSCALTSGLSPHESFLNLTKVNETLVWGRDIFTLWCKSRHGAWFETFLFCEQSQVLLSFGTYGVLILGFAESLSLFLSCLYQTCENCSWLKAHPRLCSQRRGDSLTALSAPGCLGARSRHYLASSLALVWAVFSFNGAVKAELNCALKTDTSRLKFMQNTGDAVLGRCVLDGGLLKSNDIRFKFLEVFYSWS